MIPTEYETVEFQRVDDTVRLVNERWPACIAVDGEFLASEHIDQRYIRLEGEHDPRSRLTFTLANGHAVYEFDALDYARDRLFYRLIEGVLV